MLLLQQVQQIGRRANAEEPLDRVEYDVNSAWRSHEIRAILIRLQAETTQKLRVLFAAPLRRQPERVEHPLILAPALSYFDVEIEEHARVEKLLELLARRRADRLDHRSGLPHQDRLLCLPVDEDRAVEAHQAL